MSIVRDAPNACASTRIKIRVPACDVKRVVRDRYLEADVNMTRGCATPVTRAPHCFGPVGVLADLLWEAVLSPCLWVGLVRPVILCVCVCSLACRNLCGLGIFGVRC